ncbi:MAG: hypothetical protein LUH43_07075 [Clostridia bacterium]|nr:hypothetical protein [Clostridia bacterium]
MKKLMLILIYFTLCICVISCADSADDTEDSDTAALAEIADCLSAGNDADSDISAVLVTDTYSFENASFVIAEIDSLAAGDDRLFADCTVTDVFLGDLLTKGQTFGIQISLDVRVIEGEISYADGMYGIDAATKFLSGYDSLLLNVSQISTDISEDGTVKYEVNVVSLDSYDVIPIKDDKLMLDEFLSFIDSDAPVEYICRDEIVGFDLLFCDGMIVNDADKNIDLFARYVREYAKNENGVDY